MYVQSTELELSPCCRAATSYDSHTFLNYGHIAAVDVLLGGGIGTDAGCAGCRWAEIIV